MRFGGQISFWNRFFTQTQQNDEYLYLFSASISIFLTKSITQILHKATSMIPKMSKNKN